MAILEAVRPTVVECMSRFQLPRMAIAVQRDGEPVETLTLGEDAAGRPLENNSLFPVASVTKLAVALAVLRLFDQACLELDDPLSSFVPEAASAQSGVTIRRLLCHSAGVGEIPQEGRPPPESLSWPAIAQVVLKVGLVAPPGTRVIYSSAGYDLLAILVERLVGQPIQSFIRADVFEPLGVECYLGEEPPRPVAWFHNPNDPHAGTSLESWNTPFWRRIGSPAGGMVASLPAMIGLLRAYDGHPPGYLRPETCAAAVRDQTGGLGGEIPSWIGYPRFSWGLGPIPVEGKPGFPYHPPAADPLSFCHGGYTGCLVYREPVQKTTWAIHCNLEVDDEQVKVLADVGSAVLAALASSSSKLL